MKTKTVAVRHSNQLGSKNYHFKTDLDLEVGDYVVVHGAHGYNVAKVMETFGAVTSQSTKWVVDKVDMESHVKRLEKQKKLAEVYKKLESRRKALEEIQVYRILAQEDEEMAELLKTYEELR